MWRRTPYREAAALCFECQDIDRILNCESGSFSLPLFRPGPKPAVQFERLWPRSTPRRLATLKICDSDASSFLAICSALRSARELDQFAIFFHRPVHQNFFAFNPISTS
jgi:hypothetical protein